MEAISNSIRSILWKDTFQAPIDAPITSPFGVQRVFNDEVISSHKGVDFKAKNGTPVRASNSGEVKMAKELSSRFFDLTAEFLGFGDFFSRRDS